MVGATILGTRYRKEFGVVCKKDPEQITDASTFKNSVFIILEPASNRPPPPMPLPQTPLPPYKVTSPPQLPKHEPTPFPKPTLLP